MKYFFTLVCLSIGLTAFAKETKVDRKPASRGEIIYVGDVDSSYNFSPLDLQLLMAKLCDSSKY